MKFIKNGALSSSSRSSSSPPPPSFLLHLKSVSLIITLIVMLIVEGAGGARARISRKTKVIHARKRRASTIFRLHERVDQIITAHHVEKSGGGDDTLSNVDDLVVRNVEEDESYDRLEALSTMLPNAEDSDVGQQPQQAPLQHTSENDSESESESDSGGSNNPANESTVPSNSSMADVTVGGTSVTKTLLWCSSGGGWRAMVSSMGFAQSFASAGLIADGGPYFTAMEGVSGSGWFMVQFFYSVKFYDAVVNGTPSSLSGFVTKWMKDYLKLIMDAAAQPIHPSCQSIEENISLLPEKAVDGLTMLCHLIGEFNGDFAYFVEQMLNATSVGYGEQGGTLTAMKTTSNNKVANLHGVGLNIQTSLSPNSRGLAIETGENATTYLGPGRSHNPIYTVPLPLQWESKGGLDVNDDWIPLPIAKLSSIQSYVITPSTSLSYENFEHFPLFPPEEEDDILTSVNNSVSEESSLEKTSFPQPFQGDAPTVAQIGAATSALVADLAGGCPSMFVQNLSKMLSVINGLNNVTAIKKQVIIKAYEELTQFLWDQIGLDNFSVCSEWTNGKNYTGPCPSGASRFGDGYFNDNPGVALTVGSYQSSEDCDLHKRLKIILTDNNHYETPYDHILEYWSNENNVDIEPGAFFWAERNNVPYISKQIFAETLNEIDLNDAMEPIVGTNLSTAIVEGTTLENPVYNVRRGTKVEIFLVRINSNIPTVLVVPSTISNWTDPLGNLAETIASNGELKERIGNFVNNY